MALWTREEVTAAISSACPFSVVMYKEQRLCVEELVRGNDVFGCFPTGYGKSLIYQSLPGVVRVLNRPERDVDPAVLVVNPLNAFMRDQIAFLRSEGIFAAQMGYSDEEDDSIKSGRCSVIFGSPEILLGTDGWQNKVKDAHFRNRLVAMKFTQ
eukprot:m.115996 g.115996  ORF g.115996 m.115996 type:complete len:154 (+) comp37574_c0_seq4:56-517(+)